MNAPVLTPCVLDAAHWDADSHSDLAGDLARARDADGVALVVAKLTQGRHDPANPRQDYVDSTFVRWLEACRAIAMPIGCYHFGTNTAPGADQAAFFLTQVEAHGLDPHACVLAYDDEPNPNHRLNTGTIEDAEGFAGAIADSLGRFNLHYGSPSYLARYAPGSPVGRCPLWIAEYGSSATHGPTVPRAWSTFALWQYSDGFYSASGLPKGTTGFPRMDRSVYRGTVDELRAALPGLGG